MVFYMSLFLFSVKKEFFLDFIVCYLFEKRLFLNGYYTTFPLIGSMSFIFLPLNFFIINTLPPVYFCFIFITNYWICYIEFYIFIRSVFLDFFLPRVSCRPGAAMPSLPLYFQVLASLAVLHETEKDDILSTLVLALFTFLPHGLNVFITIAICIINWSLWRLITFLKISSIRSSFRALLVSIISLVTSHMRFTTLTDTVLPILDPESPRSFNLHGSSLSPTQSPWLGMFFVIWKEKKSKIWVSSFNLCLITFRIYSHPG